MTGTRRIARVALQAFLASAVMLAAFFLTGVFSPSVASPESAFLQELKTRNAHHFAKPVNLPKAAKPLTMERDWKNKVSRQRWTLNKGPLAIEVTFKKDGPPDALLYVSPLLSLSVNGKKVIAVEGAESIPDNPIFLVQVAEMDPGNPYAEVIFSIFTGGAHCCSVTHVLTSSKDGKTWADIEVGVFDGGPLGVSDLDGNGVFEVSMRDNAFLYRFGCYACSTSPFKVLRLSDGKFINASTDIAYRDHHIESLKRILEWAAPDTDANGFLAGYVAQKTLLGEGSQAWEFMGKYYDRNSDWGLEECSVKLNNKGECPGEKMKRSYPDVLARFLKENGYKLDK